jgi:hypothetical protein
MKNIDLLSDYFYKWEKATEFSPEFKGKKITTYTIYRCFGYNPKKLK